MKYRIILTILTIMLISVPSIAAIDEINLNSEKENSESNDSFIQADITQDQTSIAEEPNQNSYDSGSGTDNECLDCLIISAPSSVLEDHQFSVSVKRRTIFGTYKPVRHASISFRGTTKNTGFGSSVTFNSGSVNGDTPYTITASHWLWGSDSKTIIVEEAGGPPASDSATNSIQNKPLILVNTDYQSTYSSNTNINVLTIEQSDIISDESYNQDSSYEGSSTQQSSSEESSSQESSSEQQTTSYNQTC